MRTFRGARIFWSPLRWAGVIHEFRKELIDVERGIPTSFFDPVTKTRWLPETQIPIAKAICAGEFGDDAVVDATQDSKKTPLGVVPFSDERPHVVLCISETAPEGVVHAAYKALERDLTPARSGSGSFEPIELVRKAYLLICAHRGYEPLAAAEQ